MTTIYTALTLLFLTVPGRAYGAELGIEAALRPWWRLRGDRFARSLDASPD